jgi:NAD(P) transhydrogenase subunit alpha
VLCLQKLNTENIKNDYSYSKESLKNETRVAAVPETVRKIVQNGIDVLIEKNAGQNAGYPDSLYVEAGAKIIDSQKNLYKDIDIITKINPPSLDEIKLMPEGIVLIANMQAVSNRNIIEKLAEKNITVFAMELMPRISRAQSMDVLSSQSNLAGYKAVLDAFAAFGKTIPMMMTAAGTIAPARTLVMGAGVAGLQAIATAKRLGSVVYASDVRPAVKEQVESLGGRFVEVKSDETAETKGGYAKEMSDDYKKRQAEAIAEQVKMADIIICTALIPGRPAPVLITSEMLKTMKEGSIIVDMAAIAGGNVEGSKPDETVIINGVKIIGDTNITAKLAFDSSALFARNIFNFINTFFNKESKQIEFNYNDDLVKGSCVTKNKEIIHPILKGDK